MSEDSLTPEVIFDAIENRKVDVFVKYVLSGGSIEVEDKIGHPLSFKIFDTKNRDLITSFILLDLDFKKTYMNEKMTLPLFLSYKGLTFALDILGLFGIDFFSKDIHGRGGLFYAIKGTQIDSFKYFVEKHGRVLKDIVDGEGKNLFEYLIESEFKVDEDSYWVTKDNIKKTKTYYYNEVINSLVEGGLDPLGENDKGENYLHLSVKKSNMELIEIFISKGLDINSVDKMGRTPLFFAAEFSDVKIFKFIVIKGGDVSLKDKEGKTCLDYAKKVKNQEVIEFTEGYLKRKHGPGEEESDSGAEEKKSALMESVEKSKENQDSKKKGAAEFNVNDKNEKGMNPAMILSLKGDLDNLKLVLDKGCNPNLRDYSGKTCLIYAVIANHKDIVEYLLEKKVDLELKDEKGQTALYYALLTNKNDLAQRLLQAKAGIQHKVKGMTILMLVASMGNLEGVKMLLDHGHDPSTKDLKGRTAEMYAKAKKHTEILALFESIRR